MSDFECPDCAGKGNVGPVHLNKGEAPHQWLEAAQCEFCKGTGRITRDLKDARDLGQKFRVMRMARDESLRDAAKRFGLNAYQLSSLERGTGGMAAWHHPFATSVYLEATTNKTAERTP